MNKRQSGGTENVMDGDGFTDETDRSTRRNCCCNPASCSGRVAPVLDWTGQDNEDTVPGSDEFNYSNQNDLNSNVSDPSH
jgi:hypothetical protein